MTQPDPLLVKSDQLKHGMVGKGLVGFRIHSQRYDIPGEADRSGAVPGAVRYAARHPVRPLRGAADPGQDGDGR